MPKKPWATKEWVDQRDYKLYTLMKDHFSPEWWERVWTLGRDQSRFTLIPCSPKFRILTGARRSGSLFRERCREAIAHYDDTRAQARASSSRGETEKTEKKLSSLAQGVLSAVPARVSKSNQVDANWSGLRAK